MSNGGTNEAGPAQPTFRKLLDWVEGRLDPEEAARIEALVEAGGPATRRSVEWIEGLVRFGRDHPMPDPPPLLRQRLRQSFDRHHGLLDPPVRLEAMLSFDSRRDADLVGVRSGSGEGAGYWLSFEAGSTTVVVDVLPEPENIRIDGQVLSPDSGAAIWQATIDHPGGTLSSLTGDDVGLFGITGVPADATKLTVSNGLVEIEIAEPLGPDGV